MVVGLRLVMCCWKLLVVIDMVVVFIWLRWWNVRVMSLWVSSVVMRMVMSVIVM